MPGKVGVKIKAGRNLPVMDRSSDTTDAYVEIKLGNTTHKTDVCRKSLNPQWNTDWYRFEVDDAELQDEPLQIRLMDHDTYSANDAIGKVNISLNPLCLENTGQSKKGKGSVMSGWIPVFDTMHGIRGEVNIIVKVDLFSDANKFRQSSCGIQFFHSTRIPHGYRAQVIHGFVEELVVNDDPEYQWIDKIRTPRASNEARQVVFLKLSGQVQRKIGLKAINLGANAVIGYTQCFDLEGDVGVVARGIGTAVTLVKIQESVNQLNVDNALIEDKNKTFFKTLRAQETEAIEMIENDCLKFDQNSILYNILGIDPIDKCSARSPNIIVKHKWKPNVKDGTILEESSNDTEDGIRNLLMQEDMRGEKIQHHHKFRNHMKKIRFHSRVLLNEKFNAFKTRVHDEKISETDTKSLSSSWSDISFTESARSSLQDLRNLIRFKKTKRQLKQRNSVRGGSEMASLLVSSIMHSPIRGTSLESITEVHDSPRSSPSLKLSMRRPSKSESMTNLSPSNLEKQSPIKYLTKELKSESMKNLSPLVAPKLYAAKKSENSLSSVSETCSTSSDDEDDGDDEEEELSEETTNDFIFVNPDTVSMVVKTVLNKNNDDSDNWIQPSSSNNKNETDHIDQQIMNFKYSKSTNSEGNNNEANMQKLERILKSLSIEDADNNWIEPGSTINDPETVDKERRPSILRDIRDNISDKIHHLQEHMHLPHATDFTKITPKLEIVELEIDENIEVLKPEKRRRSFELTKFPFPFGHHSSKNKLKYKNDLVDNVIDVMPFGSQKQKDDDESVKLLKCPGSTSPMLQQSKQQQQQQQTLDTSSSSNRTPISNSLMQLTTSNLKTVPANSDKQLSYNHPSPISPINPPVPSQQGHNRAESVGGGGGNVGHTLSSPAKIKNNGTNITPATAVASTTATTPSTAKDNSKNQEIFRRLSDSDLSVTPKGNSICIASERLVAATTMMRLSAPANLKNTNPDNLDMLEYPFLTMAKYPSGFILHLGATVAARSVKLLERVPNPDEPETRDSWWTELRMEIRSHARALGCNVILGYSEVTTISDDVCVLSATGTAAIINMSYNGGDPPQQTDFTTQPSNTSSSSKKDLMVSSLNERDCSGGTSMGINKETIGGSGEIAGTDINSIGKEFSSSFGGMTKTVSNTFLQNKGCAMCHIPYSATTQATFNVRMKKCAICKRGKVPDVILATIEIPDCLQITGRGCFMQAQVVRAKKDLRSESNAKEISDGLPFLEYELHRLLINKLKAKGMNAIFGLKAHVAIGEKMMALIATGTALFLSALPPPSVPKIVAGNSWHDTARLNDLQKSLISTVERNREIYQLKSSNLDVAEHTTTLNGSKQSDTDESDEELIELDLNAGNKDTCVLEVDDIEDLEIISLLMEPCPPDGFIVVNTQSVPGLQDFEIVRNLQMFTQIWRAKLSVGSNNERFPKHFQRLLQTIYFKLRTMIPCAICDLNFRLDLPESDEIQLLVTGMALGLGESTKVKKNRRKPITANETFSTNLNGSNKKIPDDEFIFNLEEDQLSENVTGQFTQSSVGLSNLNYGTHSLKLKKNSPSRSKFSSNSVRYSRHLPLHDRYGVDITPLCYIPGGIIEKYLGNLNFFFIRESTSIRENGGISGFVHSFITEILAVVRAHISALGGNAMISFYMTELLLVDNQHKNQGQCLVSVGGDVVFVSYFADD